MNKAKLLVYINGLTDMGIRLNQILRRTGSSTTAIQSLRDGTISDKLADKLRTKLGDIVDNRQSMHIEASKK